MHLLEVLIIKLHSLMLDIKLHGLRRSVRVACPPPRRRLADVVPYNSDTRGTAAGLPRDGHIAKLATAKACFGHAEDATPEKARSGPRRRTPEPEMLRVTQAPGEQGVAPGKHSGRSNAVSLSRAAHIASGRKYLVDERGRR